MSRVASPRRGYRRHVASLAGITPEAELAYTSLKIGERESERGGMPPPHKRECSRLVSQASAKLLPC